MAQRVKLLLTRLGTEIDENVTSDDIFWLAQNLFFSDDERRMLEDNSQEGMSEAFQALGRRLGVDLETGDNLEEQTEEQQKQNKAFLFGILDRLRNNLKLRSDFACKLAEIFPILAEVGLIRYSPVTNYWGIRMDLEDQVAILLGILAAFNPEKLSQEQQQGIDVSAHIQNARLQAAQTVNVATIDRDLQEMEVLERKLEELKKKARSPQSDRAD